MATLGRPRDPGVDDAATEAAVRLLVDEGYANLTMERIAERAGVSKAALYRRWPNKVELVLDAIASAARENFSIPDTGRVRDDIVTFVANFSRDRQPDVEAYDALLAAVMSDHELAARCRERLGGGFSAAFRVMVERGVARGELPAGTDVELLADLVPALIRYRRHSSGCGPDATYIARIVGQFFSAGS